MLFAHLIFYTTLYIDIKCLSVLVKRSQKTKFLCLGKIANQNVLSLEKLMQLRQFFILLHRAYLNPICEVMDCWLV